MTAPRRFRFGVILGLLLLAIGGTVGALMLFAQGQDSEYPDCPFEPVAKGTPLLIPMREKPHASDGKALFGYLRERQEAYTHYLEKGAYQRLSDEEKKVFGLVQPIKMGESWDADYPAARDKADKILRDKPDSVPALFALTIALMEGENNALPRALFQVRTMRHILETRGRANPGDSDSREWYIRGLLLEYEVLGLMDRREEQLRTIELLEKVNGVALQRLKIFPLVKLERFDEARAQLKAVEETGNWPQSVLNYKAMLAAQLFDRKACYEVGKQTVEGKFRSPVALTNFAQVCYGDFRFQEAEKALQECARAGNFDYNGTPNLPLGQMRLQQARLADAWQHLRKAQTERSKRSSSTLEQDQSEMDCAVAMLLLALGNGEQAEKIARRAYEAPGRTGSSTDNATLSGIRNGILLWTVLQTRLQQLREEAAASGSQLIPSKEQRELEFKSWTVKCHLLKLLGDSKLLRQCLRAYLSDAAGTDPWITGSLMQLLPPAVAAEALRQVRAEETHPRAVAYLDAYEAELQLRRGNPETALDLARKALDGLPPDFEKLLRARIQAIAGEAARQLDRMDESMTWWNRALETFPGVSRLVQYSIPVSIEHDDSPLSRQTAEALARSPRFCLHPAGFRISIKTAGNHLEMSMSRVKDMHFSEKIPVEGDAAKFVLEAVKRFHAKVLAPGFALNAGDLF